MHWRPRCAKKCDDAGARCDEPDLRRSADDRLRSDVAPRETGAVNLGQGFPDDPGPEDVRRKAAEAVIGGWNQYPPMMGLPELRQAIAAHYRHWQGLELDPDTEVMVTSGATEALAGALLALIEPGDE